MASLTSIERVVLAAQRSGITITPVTMPSSTRTAGEAAAACGCELGQIVKSLIFRGRETARPYLLLVSGANRVDEARTALAIGEALERPDGRWVRETTGFAIGGIPPFGHDCDMRVFLDADLQAYDTVWAAAGTPNAVFQIGVDDLINAAAPKIIPLKLQE
ncbi:YbaK/EbsC family protein [Stappia sp. F7233]|uniref:YbaK/EbsC family protein n=1 Tax=Stappia albiluteola TaxID=2758565 RepID=A0A839A9V6_9HYPH|nr:YbaK/EbsC family protein [Stappia albiluteola]MBA5775717.1 YbaK/EbsC family protein [Stappia albiluteola]